MVAVYSQQAEEIRTIMKNKFEVNMACGQDHLKGKLFRINNMGLIEDYKMLWIVNSIEMTLEELSIRKFDGTAAKIFSEKIK